MNVTHSTKVNSVGNTSDIVEGVEVREGKKSWIQQTHHCAILSPHHAESANTPGPGAYSPEEVTMNKPSAPKFSMGIRHSEYISPLIFDIQDKPDIQD